MVAKQVVFAVDDGARSLPTVRPRRCGPGGTVQYAAAAVRAARLGANLGQDTDPRLPFTETAGV